MTVAVAVWQSKCSVVVIHTRVGPILQKLSVAFRRDTTVVGVPQKVTYQNGTKIDELLLQKHLQLFRLLKITIAYEVKVRQFWSVFDVFVHFGIRRYGL